MSTRSKVLELPDDVRAWLDENLVDANFSGYQALAEDLRARGYEISKSSLHRYGSAFEDRIRRIKESTERARVMRDYLGDDDGATTDALIRQVQWLLEESINELAPEDIEAKDLSKLSKAIADLSRASLGMKKYMREVKSKAKEAAEEVEKVATSEGLSTESVQLIRRQILGIPAA